MIGDFLALLVGMVAQSWMDSHAAFLEVLALGLVLGGLAWWLTSWVAHNYNRDFSLHPQHLLYCAVVATFTVLLTVLFSAFSYTGVVADHMVDRWKGAILQDSGWSSNTFRQAYDAVYDLRDASGKQLEDFTNYPRPQNGQGTIPTTQEKSKQVAAETYAKAAVDHFHSHHPLLSKILWANSESAQQAISADMNRVFSTGTHTYKAQDAIQLAGEKIREGLREQVPRIVIISRIVLVIGFLLVQALIFLIMRRAALAAIKEKRLLSPLKGV